MDDKIIIKTVYPCCKEKFGINRKAKFVAYTDLPIQMYDRRCKACGQMWNVVHTWIKKEPRLAISKLEWEKIN